MPKVYSKKDGRALDFPASLQGWARLIGPQGGEYKFDAGLLRQFLEYWQRHSGGEAPRFQELESGKE